MKVIDVNTGEVRIGTNETILSFTSAVPEILEIDCKNTWVVAVKMAM